MQNSNTSRIIAHNGILQPKQEDDKSKVVMEKDEVIDILRTLEGIKRRLQPLVSK